jgi:hypothetical protein
MQANWHHLVSQLYFHRPAAELRGGQVVQGELQANCKRHLNLQFFFVHLTALEAGSLPESASQIQIHS